MKLTDLNRLLYNPAWTGLLLHYCLSGAFKSKAGKIKFELLFLIHPLLYDEVIMNRLAEGTSKMTLSTLLKDKNIQLRLIGINPRVESFREITNKSIVSIGKYLEFQEGGYVRVTKPLDYSKDCDSQEMRPYLKASQNLGLILAKEDHIEALLKIAN